jgi:hypothetical protein
MLEILELSQPNPVKLDVKVPDLRQALDRSEEVVPLRSVVFLVPRRHVLRFEGEEEIALLGWGWSRRHNRIVKADAPTV